eukprot:TRINITY_DN59628_c0_g1_i1.p1 TRINITY_DN59628_c0_g1~~TRINITY_DN59628_c0_g1_i1.p1  ORF type:complete len:936 (+),score=409.26 TRINITY_DN59628_c0_g1_i1:235-2808(+)
MAREKYLAKRAEKMHALNKMTMMEDKREKQFLKLTKAEERRAEQRERMYEKTKDRKSYADIVNEEGFSLDPSATTFTERAKQTRKSEEESLFQRYEKTDDGINPAAEQAQLEARQLQTSGALRSGKAKQIGGGDYDVVMEDEIEFITEKVLKGELEAPPSMMTPEEQRAEAERGREQAAMAIQEVRKTLPIYKVKDDLVKAVMENQVIVLVGETGSGKTTQIAQYLHEAGLCEGGKKIGCTQPRRVAAMSVAARVAQEMNVRLGSEVGYAIRFEDNTNEKTVIKYMTDGMLLREFLSSPDLESYSCMIIDEAHERSLHTDILFGLVKDVCRFRNRESGNELKIIISSATLQSDKFATFFDEAKIFNVKGRTYHVEPHYTKRPESNYIEAAALCALQIHMKEPTPGDILIFLCGQDEIEECYEDLNRRTQGLGSRIKELLLFPIYSTLPTDQQTKIFEKTPEGSRKVVIATNIAETSLTIDGIVYVIDCGFCKQKSFNPRTLMESLQVVPISQAQAEQRRGRAGRTRPGHCFRLYTFAAFKNDLDPVVVPEIQRTNLGNVLLMLKSMGIHEIEKFEFLDCPSIDTLKRAYLQLFALGAINDKRQLTKVGRMMAEFPLDPQLSKMMCVSKEHGVSDQVVTICAMLSVGNSIFHIPRDKKLLGQSTIQHFFKGGGDHLALCTVYEEWEDANFSESWCYENYVQVRSLRRARDIREQMAMLAERAEIELVRDGTQEDLLKCITSGFFYNTATRNKDGKSYKTKNPIVKNDMDVWIHPSSFIAPKQEKRDGKEVLREGPKWVVFHELIQTSREYMRQVIEIKGPWLIDIAPHLYKKKDVEEADPKKKKVMPKGTGLAPGAGQ